jgi:hypothetical protein
VLRFGLVVLVGTASLALVGAGCGGGGEGADPDTSSGTSAEPTSTTGGTDRSSTTSTTEAPTTPTSHAPDTVEGQVEQAYLEAWDVYLAGLGDPEAADLEGHFAGDALQIKQDEMAELVVAGQAVEGSVEHSYSIADVGAGNYGIVDIFQNHLVLVDASTRRPLEADPNKPQRQTFTLQLQGDRWVVIEVFNS